MLKGISKIVSPELLKILCEMGHGDEIVIADWNFPSATMGKRLIRADGIGGREMLSAVMDLIPLDTYGEDNFVLMHLAGKDTEVPVIWEDYRKIAAEKDDNVMESQIERFAFYERAKNAYAVIATGETSLYACVILKKGVFKELV